MNHRNDDTKDLRPKQSDDALLASEARFRAVFENVDALSIQGYAPDGTVTYWNPASTQLYGYEAHEALGSSLFDLIIPPPAREPVQEAVRWMFENRQGIAAARLGLMHKDGHIVQVYSSHTIVESPGHGATMFCLDIDLGGLEKAEHALDAAEQRYRALFEASGDGIVLLSGGLIVDCNTAWRDMLQTDASMLQGLSPAQLSPQVQPDGQDSAQAWQAQILAAGGLRNRVFEWVFRRRDGSQLDVELHLSAVHINGADLLIGAARDIGERKRVEARIEFMAHHDALTGLPNRVLLRDRFHQARARAERNKTGLALLFLDLDRFKIVNDTLGHSLGDALLQEVVGRLSQRLRDSDTLCRQGGDEFILLLGDVRAPEDVERLAELVLAALREPLILQGHELSVGGSIGVALYPQDGQEFEVLLQRADTAMYTAKDAGRGVARFYSAAMQLAVENRTRLDAALRRALYTGELQLHYQPQVDAGGRLLGVEALIRWFPVGEAPISPVVFIALAEETGFIHQIGQFVLETAGAQLQRWAQMPAMQHLTMAVNVSGRQFRERDFVASVADVLDRHEIGPARLKLELTESVLIDRLDEAVQRMRSLKLMGVSFSLDDFGTGYSSLSYLRMLPIDQVKIDSSFVNGLERREDDGVIVQAILAISRSMGLEVVAEGVELPAQRDRLVEFGCHCFQGWLYARAMPAAELEALVQVGGGVLPALL